MHVGNSDEYYEFLDNTIALNLAIAEIKELITKFNMMIALY